LEPVRGYLDIFSRTFTLSGGNITFGGSASLDPSINLELTHEAPELTAIIRAVGTAKKPRLRLESRPPLPQDEVLSAVLFGKRSSELSRFEAIQLADNMRTLTGAGDSLDVLTGLRREFGLDMLRLGGGKKTDGRGFSGRVDQNLTPGSPGVGGESDDASLPSLEAGKYIHDSIYVGVEQGVAGESPAVRVEVDLGHGLTLEGKNSNAAGEAGIGWKMDY
jgi:translocation and assembly module TamB